MPVNLTLPEKILPVPGVRLASAEANIRYKDRDDLALIELSEDSKVSAVFTQNAFCAAPVTVCKEHLQSTEGIRYLIINSGNANAVTGEEGYDTARMICADLADQTCEALDSVLCFSTGVIGEQLPFWKVVESIPTLLDGLNADHWAKAASAIMTTDTVMKACSEQVEIDGKTVTVSGMAKGAGMIEPNMATMLAYIATDADITQDELDVLVKELADKSFNRITIDGDTSTNDSFVLMATGKSGVDYQQSIEPIRNALVRICQHLAQAIIRDAEGATKFVTIKVIDAASNIEAKEVAYSVARSPLVKTALFAGDPNWGRLLMAIGKAPLDNLDVSRLDLWLGDVQLLEQGEPHPDYEESKGQTVMDQSEIDITIKMNTGDVNYQIWTSDLSHEYVSINADYRS